MPSIHNPKPDCSKGHKAQTLCSLPGRQWRGRSRPRPGLQSVSAPSTLIPCGMVRQLRSCPWQAAPTARLGTGHKSHSVSLLMLDQPSFKHHSTQHQAERTPHSTASLPAASSCIFRTSSPRVLLWLEQLLLATAGHIATIFSGVPTTGHPVCLTDPTCKQGARRALPSDCPTTSCSASCASVIPQPHSTVIKHCFG